jgi:hypothetical protein
VWEELPYRIAIAFINWLPNHWYRVHASTARLGFAFESFAGAKHASYVEWLEPWMRPTSDGESRRESVFSALAAEAVDLAFDLGFLSQAALAALGPGRLRDAGAFKRDRSTDTTIRGG